MAGSKKTSTSKPSTKVTSSPVKVEEVVEEKVEVIVVEEKPVVEVQEEKPAEKSVEESPAEPEQDKEDIIEEKPAEKSVEESPVEIVGKVNPKECGACKKKLGSGFCGSCILYPSL